MDASKTILKLTKLLAEAYAESVGPKKPMKGRKKLNRKAHADNFDRLARHLTELRVATMLGDRPRTGPGTPGRAGVRSATPACPPGTVLCHVPGLDPKCLTPDDCEEIGGTQHVRPHGPRDLLDLDDPHEP